MRRVIPYAVTIAVIVVFAMARTIIIRPDPCLNLATSPRIIDLTSLVEKDTASTTRREGGVEIIYLEPAEGWASRRLLSRFRVERGADPDDCLR